VAFLARPTLQFTHYSEDPGSCELIGDTDVYGIGVRISFYLNWAAAFIAMMFNMHEEHKGVRRAINAIAIAVVTNTIINATKGSFANLEWYIVFTLVLVLPFLVAIPFSWTAMKDDILGLSLLMLLYLIYGVIQPWLYFVIPRQGYKEGCPARIFLFAPVDLYNPHWVGFTKAMAILSCITSAVGIPVVCCIILYGLYGGWKKPAKVAKKKPPNDANNGTGAAHNPSDLESHDPHDVKKQLADLKKVLKPLGIFFKIYLGFSGASSIAFVEETIRINHIDLSDASIRSTGQLIPFIVGVFSLVAVMWNGIKQWRKKGSEEDEHASSLHDQSQPRPPAQHAPEQRAPQQYAQPQHAPSRNVPLPAAPSWNALSQHYAPLPQQDIPLWRRNQ
jgi:hypothetical protein